jgi:protoheme IX farnesyltransferase
MKDAKTDSLSIEGTWAGDLLALTKPGLTTMAVGMAAGGAFLASHTPTPYHAVFHTVVGTFLVGGGAGALNQWREWTFDGAMRRTADRPIPSGRLRPIEGLAFGAGLSIAGLCYLLFFTNVLAFTLAATTLATYLFLYTPLKRITPFAIVIGGIPGAIPPLIGWAVVSNSLNIEAWSLFGIMFFWQMPHFLALAWMYRKDYERAGFRTLPVVDPSGRVTGRQALVYAIALVPASVLPTYAGLLGHTFFVGSIALSVGFLFLAFRFFRTKASVDARRLFFGSLLYLPGMVLLMILDRM